MGHLETLAFEVRKSSHRSKRSRLYHDQIEEVRRVRQVGRSPAPSRVTVRLRRCYRLCLALEQRAAALHGVICVHVDTVRPRPGRRQHHAPATALALRPSGPLYPLDFVSRRRHTLAVLQLIQVAIRASEVSLMHLPFECPTEGASRLR